MHFFIKNFTIDIVNSNLQFTIDTISKLILVSENNNNKITQIDYIEIFFYQVSYRYFIFHFSNIYITVLIKYAEILYFYYIYKFY